jgi:hypothetical protein
MEFIDGLSPPSGIPQILWLSKPGHRWPKSNNSIVWKQITHSHVGGSTKTRGTFGSRNFHLPLDLPQELQRSLAHVVKFSIRPQACSPVTVSPHHTLDDRLSISWINKPVLYPTYMSSTGWGIRPLDDSELSACYDLPIGVEWNPSFVTTIAPLQLFRSIIDFVVDKRKQ